MAITKTATIPWAPLTSKHVEYIKKAVASNISIAEGAIRSGKTIDHCIIATAYLEICPDRIHLATGSTVRNAKLNIGDCNGFGLEHLFRGRCRWGKHKDNEALFLNTQTGEKVVIFAGGGKADSYKGILGNSYGLWIATEINEHYLNCKDPKESFVHVAIGRQAAAKRPMRLWDLNPSNPHADIYTFFIDPYIAKGTCNYGHFTLHDNGSLTPERIREIESEYIPGTIWHTRDILGERCITEGLVFPYFASNSEKHVTNAPMELGRKGNLKVPFNRVVIGGDFGGNGSQTCFCATGYHGNERLHVFAEDALPLGKAIDANDICRRFVAFYRRVIGLAGRVDWCFLDSASPTLINSIISAMGAAGLPNREVIGCRKNPISQRPITIDRLLGQKRLTFGTDCTETVRALRDLRWSKKRPDEPEDLNVGNINDRYDAFCYTWIDFVEYIDRQAVRR